jgi:hypothetical protein
MSDDAQSLTTVFMSDDEPGFVTATDLREREMSTEDESPSSTGTDTSGRFQIPARPTRTYPHTGGVEYVGGTIFSLSPVKPHEEPSLVPVVERILAEGPYRWGDWLDLPLPLYLVHDDTTHDTFRVSVRDGQIRLHVLPDTDSDGLLAFYERLTEYGEWTVERHVDDSL